MDKPAFREGLLKVKVDEMLAAESVVPAHVYWTSIYLPGFSLVLFVFFHFYAYKECL